MPHDPERLALDHLAGDLEPEQAEALRRRVEADPEAQAAVERLEEVVQALRNWRAGFDALPHPALPSPRQLPWWRSWPAAAAAAALVLLLLGWLLVPKDQPPGPQPPGPQPPAEDWADHELAGLLKETPAPPAREPLLTPSSPREGPGLGGPGGPKGGADLSPDVLRLFDQFRGQFDFRFRLPARLPEGYELERATPLSPLAVRLTYVSGERRRDVYLKAAPGPDEPARQWRGLWTARRAGLAFALAADDLSRDQFESLLALFLPE